jgi:hypothetical protein
METNWSTGGEHYLPSTGNQSGSDRVFFESRRVRPSLRVRIRPGKRPPNKSENATTREKSACRQRLSVTTGAFVGTNPTDEP